VRLWTSRCHTADSVSALNNWCFSFDPP
jgi:hypothetical protein